jgi:hypothetical protein
MFAAIFVAIVMRELSAKFHSSRPRVDEELLTAAQNYLTLCKHMEQRR